MSEMREIGGVAASVLRRSRIAGFWYLMLTVFGFFGLMYVPSQILVHGDAAATVANLVQREYLLRAGIAANVIGAVSFLFLGLAFYRLFESVNRDRARMLLVLVLASIPVTCLSVLAYIAALAFAGGGNLAGFESEQLRSLAMLMLDLEKQTILVSGVFWGLWLLPLGLLMLESRYVPAVFGYLLIAGCVGYVVDSAVALAAPAYAPLISPIATTVASLGELPFLLWFLIRGARLPQKSSARFAAAA